MGGQLLPQECQQHSDNTAVSELVSDIQDALSNPAHAQAIRDAVVAAGVLQRPQGAVTSSTPAGTPQQALRDAGGMLEAGCGSPKSTITFSGLLQDQQRQQPQHAGCSGAPVAACADTQLRRASKQDVAEELKQQVESLLQRTDSILSRSSGHSVLQNTPGGGGLATTASSPGGLRPLHQELGGFDFSEAADTALDTPTLARGPGRAAQRSASIRRRVTGTRLSLAGVTDSGGAGELLSPSGSLTPPIGSSMAGGLAGWPPADDADACGDVGAFSSRTVATGQRGPGAHGERVLSAGAGAGAGGGRQLVSLASRLSQQALDEIKDRLEGEAPGGSRFSSGLSCAASHTAAALDRASGWRAAAAAVSCGTSEAGGDGGAADAGPCVGSTNGPSIYADFGPLHELIDTALTDLTAGGGGRGSSANNSNSNSGGAASRWAAATKQRTLQRLGSSVVFARSAGGGSVGHRGCDSRTLRSMLQPDYLNTTTLSRLKSELAAASRPPPSTPGGSAFDVKLLALTARLSHWSQQERVAAQTFHQLLESLLDAVFASASLSKGRTAPTQPPASNRDGSPQPGSQQPSTGASSSSKNQTAPPQPAGGACTTPPPVARSKGGTCMSGAPAANDMATSHSSAAGGPKPTDSMLRAAFAKLALGPAKLRPASVVQGSASRTPAPVTAAACVAGSHRASEADVGVVQHTWCDSSSTSSGSDRPSSAQRVTGCTTSSSQPRAPAGTVTPASQHGSRTCAGADDAAVVGGRLRACLGASPARTAAAQQPPRAAGVMHSSAASIKAWSPGSSSLALARQFRQQQQALQQQLKQQASVWQQHSAHANQLDSARRTLFLGSGTARDHAPDAAAAADTSRGDCESIQQCSQLWLQTHRPMFPGRQAHASPWQSGQQQQQQGCIAAVTPQQQGVRPWLQAPSPAASSAHTAAAQRACCSRARGARAGVHSPAPPTRCIPLAGGCLAVYADAVEVHAQVGSPQRVAGVVYGLAAWTSDA